MLARDASEHTMGMGALCSRPSSLSHVCPCLPHPVSPPLLAGPVAHLFYFPVLGALIQSLRSQGPTLPTFSSSSSPLAIEHLVGLGRGGADSRKGGGGDATHGAQTLGSGLKEESDGIDALLPSRALLALGAFVKSSVNTPAERCSHTQTQKLV